VLGQTLGSYSILERLGAGAMGEVYLGEHRHLKRRVAIKLLAKELMSRPELLERFFMEARATSVIAHPGIVQIFDCEVDADGRPYIVMEYLSGETLGRELARRQGPLPVARAIRLARGIAEALEAAHEKGIIHRDLKPDNVFVSPEPAATVKVVDFGIAKLVGELRAASLHQTHSGTIMGTPLYMSPEQCRGSGNLDYRTDLYSLGCVFFEMLAGRPPFVEEGMGELLVAHLRGTPPAVESLNPEVPAVVAALVTQLLSKEPSDRPLSMQEVAERLSATIAPGSTYLPGPGAGSGSGTPRGKVAITTLGSSAAEKEEPRGPRGRRGPDDENLQLPRSRTPLVVGGALLLLLGGGGAFLALGRGADAGSSRAGLVAPPVVTPPGVAVPPPVTPSGVAVPPPVTPPAGTAAPALTPPPAVTSPSPSPVTRSPGVKPPSPSLSPSPEKRSPVVTSSPSPSPVTPSPVVTPPMPAPEEDEQARVRHEPVKMDPIPRKNGNARVVASSDEPTGEKPSTEGRPSHEEAAAKPSTRSPEPRGLAGIWEGPWVDADVTPQVDGRLYLVVQSDGQASGWLNNKRANESFRVVGRVREQGQVDLTCQCPAAQMFTVRGALRLESEGEGLTGGLALWSGGRAFGHPRATLRRKSGSP